MRVALVTLIIVVACGGRATSTDDAAVHDAGPRDAVIVADSGTDGIAIDQATPRCSSLKQAGSVLLDVNDRGKASPRIAYDGESFAVAWHSQPAEVSSLIGELRFSVVKGGSASSEDGITIAGDNGEVPHTLVASPSEYGVLHKSPDSQGHVLRRFDGEGRLLGTVAFRADYNKVALAKHGDGYAVLLADRLSPALSLIDGDGTQSEPTGLITAQVMASLWLASYVDGIAAALHSTNNNATLYLLDQSGTTIRKQANVGGGLSIRSPRFAVRPGGFAAVYGTSSGDVEIEIYDRAGESQGRTPLARAGAEIAQVDDIALAWTGNQLIVVHPGPGGHQLRLVEPSGQPLGSPIAVPKCLASATGVDAAWGDGQIAVASMTSGSGVPYSGICVMVMACE